MVPWIKIACSLVLVLFVVTGSAPDSTRAQELECWWCSSTELGTYEYCDDNSFSKHGFLGMAGYFEGPPHPEYRCGNCSGRHGICAAGAAAAAAALNGVIADGGDLPAVLKQHARFAQFNPRRRQVILRDCEGKVAETLDVPEQQVRSVAD